MTKRMLIDATHPEETRVVVINGNRLEEFDFETSSKKQLKGNIYLAKVTRVEPSLQAAFVEYGGNRHGFLAFTEIHPDYYRIPVADREALLAAEIEAERAAAAREFADAEPAAAGDDQGTAAEEAPDEDDDGENEDAEEEDAEEDDSEEEDNGFEDRTAEEDDDEAEERGKPGDTVAAADPYGDGSSAGPAAGAPRVGSADAAGAVAESTFFSGGESNAPREHAGVLDAGEAPGTAAAGTFATVASDPSTGAEYIAAAVETRADYVAEAVADEHSRSDDQPDRAGEADDGAGRFADTPLADERPVDAPFTADTAGQAGAAEQAPDHRADAEEDRGAATVVPAPEPIETVGGDDVEEAHERHAFRPRRNYKIQEVIKRRQIMLVQVTKEERGNKGAALTTYLSLAGRYCVLMPNTPRGGGISRKITNPKERKRMKAILDGLQIPEGMAVILRTAGLERTRTEIKRDLDYLLRLWDSIREQTLVSTAPTLIHEEANLIKRAIRDLYSKDIDEILVAGDEGYRAAKDFMRMLMPSHAKKVKPYKDDPVPLFHRFQVEGQIDAMHSPIVQLRSGGYIVINPTEALVAIDVNSGRATRERNIEETAYKTNLEAADEIARQLRLRDLAGLIVIDFIDMEDDRHNAAVERRLKEAMKIDRARIQLGRISPFGLLELSRQRLRPSLVETHFETCRTCGGTGLIRSLGSAALHLLRAIEEEGLRRRSSEISVHVPTNVALYVLNQKRDVLLEIENRYGFRVLLEADDTLIPPDYRLERTRARSLDEVTGPVIDTTRLMAETDAALAAEAEEPEAEEDLEEDEEEHEESLEPSSVRAGGAEERGGRGRRRRSRRGRRRGDEPRDMTLGLRPSTPPSAFAADTDTEEEAGEEDEETADHPADAAAEDDSRPRRKRRRGKRGGRRRATIRRQEGEVEIAALDGQDRASDDGMPPAFATIEDRLGESDNPLIAEDPDEVEETADTGLPAGEAVPVRGEGEGEAKPRRRSRRRRSGEAAGPDAAAGKASAEVAGTVAGTVIDAEVVEAELVETAEAAPEALADEAPAAAAAAAEAAGREAVAAPAEPAQPEIVAAEPLPAAPEPAPQPLPEQVPEQRPHDVSVNGQAEPAAAAAAKAEPVEENTAVAANQVINPSPERPRRGWWQRSPGNG